MDKMFAKKYRIGTHIIYEPVREKELEELA